MGLRCCLHPGNVGLNAGAQLQIPAQRPQACGDLRNLRLGFSISPPFPLVQFLAPLGQGVYIRLNGVVLHGELAGRLDAVLTKVAELLLVAVQLQQFFPHGKRRPFSRAARRRGIEQIEIPQI